jgi:ABC-type Fe3+-siderophore transport system permease subunit
LTIIARAILSSCPSFASFPSGRNLLMAQSATRNPVPDPSLREAVTSSQSADFGVAAKGSAGAGVVVLCIGALSGGLIVFIIGLLQSWCVRC